MLTPLLVISVALFSGSASAISLADVGRDPSLLLTAKPSEIQGLAGQASGAASAKLKNLATLRQKLDDCLTNAKDTRGFRGSILGGAMADPCIANALGHHSPLAVTYDLSSISNAANFKGAQKAIGEKALTDSARAIFDYRTQFEGAKPLPNPGDKAALDKLANEACSACSLEQKEFFKNSFIQQMKTAPRPPTQFAVADLVFQQDQILTGLNSRISEMEVAKNKGDEADFNRAYQRYLDDYQRYAGTPAGALFLTDSVREAVGKVLTPEDVSKKFLLFGEKTFPKHRLLSSEAPCASAARCRRGGPARIKMGLAEIEDKIGDFTNQTLKAESFSELVKVNPAMVGQMLVVNPNLMGELCTAIQEVSASDVRTRDNLKVLDTGLMVLDAASMGLMVTGVGGIVAKAATSGIRMVAQAGVRAAVGEVARGVATTEGRAAMLEGAKMARVGASTSGKILARTAFTGAASEAGHALSDGSTLVAQSGYRDLLVASRMARATTDIDMKAVAELEHQWNKSFTHLAEASLMNALPIAQGLMKLRNSKFMTTFMRGKTDLASELAIDAKLAEAFAAIGDADLQVMGRIVKEKGLNSEALAGALAVVAQTKDGVKTLAKGLKGNAEQFLTELSQAGGKALTCAI